MGYKFVKLNELRYESYHAPGRAQHLRALLVMVDDIEKAVLGRGSCGWSQHEIVRVQVLEEVDSAGVEVVVAPHLDELSARVNAHLLVPVALHDNLLWLVAQLVKEHGLDDTIVDEYLGVASTLLVALCGRERRPGLPS